MAGDLELKLRITADGKVAVERLRDVDDAVESLGSQAERSARKADGLFDALAPPARIALGINELAELFGRISGPLKNIVDLSDQYRNLAGRIDLVTESADESAAVMDRLSEIAQSAHAPLQGVAELHVRLANALKESGRSQEEILGVTQALSDAMLVSGANATEASAAMVQLAQGLSSGALRGDEFNSVAEQMPVLLDALAQQLGVSRGELREKLADYFTFYNHERLHQALDYRTPHAVHHG